MMGGFIAAAVALLVVAAALLLRPWWRTPRGGDVSAEGVTRSIYRDQLAELDRDLAAGTLAQADHDVAKAELQRRLLEDSRGTETKAASPAAPIGRGTAIALALAVPLLAGALYGLLGTPQALSPVVRQPNAHTPTGEEIEKMLAALEAKLAAKPDDPKGWTMLARSYRVLGRLPAAEKAYAHIGEPLQKDPTLLSEYADVLAANAGGNLEGKPLALVNTALQIDPEHPMALSLAATAAYNRSDWREAERLWQKLLAVLPPESEDAKFVSKTIDEVRAKAGLPAAAPAAVATAKAPPVQTASPTPAAPAATTAAAGGAGTLTGTVRLAPALAAKASPDDTVFVFARAVEGPRMPLAVQRGRVADLPLQFRLDDSTAMSPASTLSKASAVRVEVRVSKSGTAMPSPGDLIGSSDPVKPGASGLTVTVDKVQP